MVGADIRSRYGALKREVGAKADEVIITLALIELHIMCMVYGHILSGVGISAVADSAGL